MESKQFLDWTVELQALAQGGLAYTKNPYDRERFVRIRQIAGEMLAAQTGLPLETIKEVFLNETGYQTPKIETRAAVFCENKILLVRETIDGRWSLPGGWCDVDRSVGENVVKEAFEEAGVRVRPVRLIALQDRKKHHPAPCPYGVIKAFVLCEAQGGDFQPNVETSECGYFPLDALPPLSIGRNTPEQIRMCFDAHADPDWVARFD